MGYKFSIIFFFLFTAALSSQSICGTVIDEGGEIVMFPNALLYNTSDSLLQSTEVNMDGKFCFENLKPGSYKFTISYIGLETFKSSIIEITSNENHLEQVIMSDGPVYATIMYRLGDDYAITMCEGPEDYPIILDHHPLSDVLSLKQNKINVYRASSELAGTFDDPSRVLYRSPGISTNNDQANGIIYRGLPSDHIKWTIEGAEIVNPNHLSNAGTLSDQSSTSAGGVLAIPLDVFSTFSFEGQPYEASSISSLTGVNNMRFNLPSTSFLKFGLLGMEASYQSKGKTNLRVHGRYSTVGLLSDLGIDFDGESIKFQDVFFQFNFSEKFKYTGIVGSSSNLKSPIADASLATTQKDLDSISYRSNMQIHGLSYIDSKMEHHLFYSHKKDRRYEQSFPSMQENGSNFKEERLSYRGGFTFSDINLNLNLSAYNYDFQYEYSFFREINFTARPALTYSREFKIGDRVAVIRPTAAVFFDSHQHETSFEPSLTMQIEIGDASLLQFHSSLASQLQSPYLYGLTDTVGQQLNHLLERNKTFANAVSFKFQKGFNFVTRIFYQSLYNLPESLSSIVSSPVMNGIDYNQRLSYRNNGTGKSYGVDLMIDREFNKNFFVNVNTSFFETTFNGLDASNNFGFTANLVLSKSHCFSDNRCIKSNIALHYRGGAVVNNISEMPFYQQQLSNYFRIDTRIQYIWKKKNTLTLDIQNVINRLNDAYYYREPITDQITLKKQLGLIPILSYKRAL